MDPNDYLIAISLFPRFIGVIYFFAFGAFIFQIRGLLGREGILPVPNYLDYIKHRFGKKAYYYVPTLFWFNASDAALMGLVIAGTALSFLLACGIYPALLLPLLFILHLSLVTAGQDFLSFGWESFMLEITINATILSWSSPPNPFSWISLNLLLFRFYFQAGISKFYSRDVNWRNMTAISHHYQTQPLPNTVAWYIHKLPMWFHKVSTALMFFGEIVVPFGIFASEDIRLLTCAALLSLQFSIWVTGNLSYLNHLSIAFGMILISDFFWRSWLGMTPQVYSPSPLTLQILTSALGTACIFLQIISLWNYLFRPVRIFSKILNWISPFHIANRYGIFAVMTTKRYEIIVEGSNDQKEWHEYLFRYKPSDLNRRPKRISPYQPRLDWQAWFLPFSNFSREMWFQNFLVRLLQGSPRVLKLLRSNPFPDHPPKYIRALAYDYEFSDSEAKKKEGVWWKRRLVGIYAPTISLSADKDAGNS